ncbi:hypothetical protein NVP1115B_69 [Vibrio phage 1.115.B._10N.222.49.B11]|nr:hypothetical protein NVP1115A_69 [Vibrio phage 1.115.A._10N.222.49.B11]AUR88615.1 hypothetical protein NVP1115B_69 [Vibrio phage 1.115.B._10N.222.49.B11]
MSNVEKEMKYTFIRDYDFDEIGVITIAYPESCSIKFESDESQSKVKLIRVLLEGENPEPQKQYRYEKVTESIFDLKDEFECGELYSTNIIGDRFYLIDDSVYLAKEYGGGSPIYRKVEIDHVEELAKEFHQNTNNAIKNGNPGCKVFSWQDAPPSDREMHLVNAKHAIDKLGSK